MKVSVIIPTYKRSEYLKRAIDSVLNQSYNNIEIIVVDDNNPDTDYRKTNELVMKEYEHNNNIIYIKHKKNMNGAVARNTGIKKASGDYITFLDDDDFFLKDRLKNIIEYIKNTNYDAVYTGVITINHNHVKNIFSANKSGNLQYELLHMNSLFKTGSNLFFKSEVFKNLKGFDSSYIRHQDIEFMLRFFDNYKIGALNDYSVVKDDSSRINFPNSKIAIEMREKLLNEFDYLIKKYDKNEIYYFNYLNLYNIINDDRVDYIINKINQYGKLCHKQIIKKKLKNTFKVSRSIVGNIRGFYKYHLLNRDIRENLFYYINEYKI